MPSLRGSAAYTEPGTLCGRFLMVASPDLTKFHIAWMRKLQKKGFTKRDEFRVIIDYEQAVHPHARNIVVENARGDIVMAPVWMFRII